MRLSDDRVNALSHKVCAALADDERVEFKTVSNSVRLAIRRSLGAAMQREAEIDQRVRGRIQSQKRQIEEGTSEWEALYWDYYEAEISSLHVIK
jgi:hypothetical protein